MIFATFKWLLFAPADLSIQTMQSISLPNHRRHKFDTNICPVPLVLGLYAGFWPATIGHLPGNTIYLVAYTYLKDRLQQVENARHPGVVPDGRQAAWVSFSAAMGADLAAVGLYCPVDVVVQRLFLQSAHQPKYSGYRDVIETIMKTEGWKGFYRGVGPILVNSLPASAVWWTLYEECKTWFSVWLEDYWYKSSVDHTASGAHVVHKHALANIAAGGLAGAVVTFLTNPLDVVRTRLQTQSMEAEAYHYNSAMHTIREMWAAEGVKAFFKGTTPRLTQWVVFSSASAFAYEFIVDISTIKK